MKKRLITAACVLFWLAVWQVGAMLLGQELLLVSPVRAAGRLLELIPTEGFLRSVAFSSGRILGGFGLGLTCGTLLALLAGKFRFVRTLLAPLVAAVKAVPVASITVLALVWVSSRNLSVLVTFLIALPVVYSNMLESLGSMDPKLTEMAELYHISGWKRFAGVYLSQLLPGFCSAAKLAIGLSWKSGAAAEVIGIPSGSIGEKLYEAKVYLETADLFAWTIAVILLSWLSEKLFLFLVGLAVRAVSGKNAFRCSKLREPDNSPARLRAEGVTKRFGVISALDGFSAEFQPGSTTAVMGASGCGKTTLLRIISGCSRRTAERCTVRRERGSRRYSRRTGCAGISPRRRTSGWYAGSSAAPGRYRRRSRRWGFPAAKTDSRGAFRRNEAQGRASEGAARRGRSGPAGRAVQGVGRIHEAAGRGVQPGNAARQDGSSGDSRPYRGGGARR